MNLKDRIAVFDRDSKLLQEITSSFPRGSEQHQALQHAVSALWYVLRDGHAEFQKDFGIHDRRLSPAHKKRIQEAANAPDFDFDQSA